MIEPRTERLVLRAWRAEDRAPFAQLNADPVVMGHFEAPLTHEESDELANRIAGELAERGWGLWAVEADGAFIGFVGLQPLPPRLPAAPAVEVGWRLAREAWGHGYATEAARVALGVAFDELALDEVVSLTATTNERSQAVMRRLGMAHDPADDFDHPALPPGHRLERHVLWRARRPPPA